MAETQEKPITINGKPASQEALQDKKEQVKKTNGMDLVEVKKGTYRTRLQD